MCQFRKDVLDAELKRIEAEAEARSIAVMNKADALAAAHRLCALINDVQPKFFNDFTPTVGYYTFSPCEILIYTHNDGDILLRRLDDLMLTWEDSGKWGADAHDISVEGFPGVRVIVGAEQLAAHQRQAEAA